MGEILKMDGKAILIIFIGTIIAITFLSTYSDSIFSQTNTISFANSTQIAPASNTSVDITGRTLLGVGDVRNATNSSGIDLTGSGGVFLRTALSSTTGLSTVQLVVNDTGIAFAGEPINMTYNAEPDGYLPLASSRTIISLVILFGALAILVFTIVVLIQRGSWKRFIGR